jgi:long-chain acyl-CoA synthetase
MTDHQGPAGRPPWQDHYPPGVDWSMDIPTRPVHALLEAAVAANPSGAFIDFLGRRFTYGEAADLIAKTARGLQRLGIRKGMKVGLLMPNCTYSVICFFAILKAGGTVVNYNPLDAERDLIRRIENSETDVVMTLDLAPLCRKLVAALGATRLRYIVVCPFGRALPWPKSVWFRLAHRQERARLLRDSRCVSFDALASNDGACETLEIAPLSDIAVIQYTGGTAGEPKGVMLSHQNIYANTCQIRAWFTKAEPGRERLLAVLPFFHCFGMTAVMTFAVSLQAELIILPRFNLKEVLQTIARKRVTLLVGVPTLFNAINQHRQAARYDFSSLKICISGGDALPRAVQERFLALTGCQLAEGYGLTECAPVATCSNPLEGVERAGSCGLPLPRTTIEIVSTEDRQIEVPAGQVGEICVRGPQVMLGYWKEPAATADSLVSGRLHTGDIGRMDKDGFVYFLDRLKEVIAVHGYKVYPRRVEDAIRLHPGVADVAVIGIPDPVRGHAPKAFIVRVPGAALTEEALRAFLADKLSAVEIPRSLEFRDSLPKSAAGKTLKRATRA